eukprot:146373_1
MIIFVYTCLLYLSHATAVTISNTKARKDIYGQLMDVHDGTIIQWNNSGFYYWYGMGYGNCTEPKYWDCSPAVIGVPTSMCGFQPNHTVNIYASSDMIQWRYIGDALPFDTRPFGVYFRPKVIYNERTKQYVLWINYVSYHKQHHVDYHNTSYIVAVSDTPDGPFTIKTNKANVLYSQSPGDFVLFIDKDTPNHTAYIAYDAMQNHHRISIEPLSLDYLDSIPSRNSGLISSRFHEAPAMFKRNGWYYLIFGHCCCFCSEGSDAKVYVSNASALGPYVESHMNLNQMKNTERVIIHAQQNFIAEIKGENGETQYLWTGDRWKSASDTLKGHDLQYWQLLSFNDSLQPPQIAKLHWQDNVTLDLR